ncbi:hypothetical protein FQA39_LY15417 [Lamprigera yunnana]|nr:hypothetical protein FQA39_LY15417 [Lamprigera yunnana]
MSNEDSIEIRQENEIEALKAIFGDALEDLRGKTAWNLWKPLDVKIKLTPQQGGSGVHEVYATVDLHVICSKKYPNELPQIQLKNEKGISKRILENLRTQLKEQATSLLGEVMIFELAQYTQSFLYQHNKPGFKSFYEEMLNRQKAEEQQLEQAKQMKRNREREVMLNEIQKRKEILESEIKLRRERYSTETSEDSGDLTKNRKSSTSVNEELSQCEHKGTQIIEFTNNGIREIQRGRCINHASEGIMTYYNGLDIETGELFAVGEWIINLRNVNDFQIQRQVASIEQEVNYLVKLKHCNIVHYLNIKDQLNLDNKKIVVNILQEFVIGLNCLSILNDEFPIDTEMLRHISRGILSALEFLHRNNVIHREITGSCVYINSNGTVKLGNYSIYKRLSDLVTQNQILNTYNKKTDIYQFGVLLLSLIQGASISEESIELPPSLPMDLRHFLTRCLGKEEKERFTAAQLLNHPFLKFPVERLSPQRNINEYAVNEEALPEGPHIRTFSHSNSTGQSRVESEFEVMQWIGKGAFGEVLKVRNKLDGGQYALKRIDLNPKNKQLNRKITREVKLLSKLNHENVVRYYNAWIESAIIDVDKDISEKTISSSVSTFPKLANKKELTFNNDVEMLAPPLKDVEWSISYESKSKPGNITEESSDDDDDDEEEWGVMLNADSSESDSIEFERDDGLTISECDTTNDINSTKQFSKTESPPRGREIQFMYIQMEFCEKSTLRTAIDSDLHLDKDRIWRLFREIIEGLAHIHQQGMIHRDLKPVNIFLDFNDHVKIGDFGLATTSIFTKSGDFPSINKSAQENEKTIWSPEIGDGSLTGHVGTALYTAPELTSSIKTIYNQKVDIYSLGVILFEMCYIPLKTQMERMQVLSGLRIKDVLLPSDFKTKEYHKQEILIRWLLNHDVSKRPTSQELLQSELVPPPVVEEEKMREMFRHTLNNPQTKEYKYLIASCFQQPITPAQDITYDMNMSVPNFTKSLQIFHYVKEIVKNIFHLHGGQSLSTPLLLPKSKYYDGVESSVKLMTHSGSIISLPHDLRVSFARYVAWNNITFLRRYSIERVYREKKIFGFHPRELFECAFDIVTSTPGNFMSDAEVLFIVNQIISALPGLRNKNFYIRLNHVALIKAILLHCGVKERHNEVFNILADAKEGKMKLQIKTHLISLGLSDNSIATLFHLVEMENTLPKIISTFQMITKKKSSEAGILAKQGLQELKVITQNAEALGVTINIVIAPGLIYNAQQYSGMMCQFVCELKKKRRKGGMEVLAAGGRYDNMIMNYRNIKEEANMLNKEIQQSAVGISISLDKLVQALQEESESESVNVSSLDAVMCSLSSKVSVKERFRILKDLWSAGIRCILIEAVNLEEIQELRTELNVPYVIMLKDSEQGVVRICHWDKDKFQEKSVNVQEVVENVQRVIRLSNEGSQEHVVPSTNVKFENRINNSCESSHEATVSIVFVTLEKLSPNTRKRYENQIKSQLDGLFKRLSGEVIVLGLNVDASIIRSLTSYLDFDTEQLYYQSVKLVLERHQRQKKDLIEICDEIYDLKLKQVHSILILYSISDNFYKILIGCDSHLKTEEITFDFKRIQKVWRGQCINHTNQYIDFRAMDKDTGQLYVIKEISFDNNIHNFDDAKQLFCKLIDLQHENLFEIENFTYKQISEYTGVFYILQSFDFGFVNILLFSMENYVLDTMQCFIDKYTVNPLTYLKEKEVCVNMHPSVVYINNKGDIKLYDFGLDTDIFKTIDTQPSKEIVVGHSNLMKFGLLLNSYSAFEPFFDIKVDEFANEEPPLRRTLSTMEKDFDTLEELGRGGFGKVYKVKDKIIGKCYALKKIKLKDDDQMNKKIIKEVQCLSSFEHKNIVRYYHSWIDMDEEDSFDEEDLEYSEVFPSSSEYLEVTKSGCNYYPAENKININDDKNLECNQIVKLSTQKILCIQMEFCEHDTLKNVIETTKLFTNSYQIWVYFKQIIDGLHYIHDQGIIHRDLKPSNIFLDHNNQIKIGDFGFATTNKRSKCMALTYSHSQSSSLTSAVGTSYYIAPELISSAVCGEKIDMYSLGIILFEMCYESFKTGTERHIVLSKLRSEKIEFPDDFDDILGGQKEIIRQLLNHNVEERPSCENLRNLNTIPWFEEDGEKQLQIVRRFVNDPQSDGLKCLLKSYIEKDSSVQPIKYENVTFLEATIKIVVEIFRKHGGHCLDLSISTVRKKCSQSCRKCFPLITENGLVFVLPCNSRMTFLEYVSFYNVTWLRRYTVQKLKDFSSFNNYECSFDIVTPINLRENNVFLPDAEILLILYEIITSFRNLVPHNFSININHSMLFEAILEECQISKSPFYDEILLVTEVYSYFVMNEWALYNLMKNYLSRDICNKYNRFLEDSINYFNRNNAYLEKFQNSNAKKKACTALNELTNIVTVAEELGFKHKVNLKPSLVKAFQLSSGMMVELCHTHKYRILKIAEGIRYDRYLKSLQASHESYRNYGVGLTVSPKNLNFILKNAKSLKLSEVVVCCYSNKVIPNVHEVLKLLWNNDICCSYVKLKSKKHRNDYCSRHNVSCIVTLTNKGLQYDQCLISHRNYSFMHHKIKLNHLIPMLKIILNQEQTDQVIVSNKEQPIFYKTTFKLSLYDKVKCKVEVAEYLNNLPTVMENSVFFVTNLPRIKEFMLQCLGQSKERMIFDKSTIKDLKSIYDILKEKKNENKLQAIFLMVTSADGIVFDNVFSCNIGDTFEYPTSSYTLCTLLPFLLKYDGCDSHLKSEEITFDFTRIQTVWRGQCINHTNQYIDFRAMDKETGQLYIVKEISFDNNTHNFDDTKQLFCKLIELRHENLFEIENFTYKQISEYTGVFYILQSFDFGFVNLLLFSVENIVINTIQSFIYKCTSNPSTYLKEKGICVNMHPSVVYINNKGDVKLYDFGLDADIFKTIDTEPPKEIVVGHIDEFANEESPLRRTLSTMEKDFDMLEVLGRGNFGKVYKVKDKIVGKYYALKRIKLKDDDQMNKKIIKEVKCLSSLEHKNIVRYYHSWIDVEEEDSLDEEDSKDSEFPCFSSTNDDKNLECNEIVKLSTQNILYIKMEFCEHNTLENIINTTNLFTNSNQIWLYFKQIVDGLHHIHDKGIIHRDLKPNNIFLDHNNQIKIGDFGFATTNKLNKYMALTYSHSQSSSLSAVGTSYYIAPELKSSVVCGEKIDMYSLGIILFEMCYESFKTGSERHIVLSKLRSENIEFPDDFNEKLSGQKEIIRQLLNHNVEERPSCENLLNLNIISSIEEDGKEQLQIIQRFVNDPQSNGLKCLLKSYIEKDSSVQPINYENVTFLEATIKIVVDIFRRHGGQCLDLSISTVRKKCSKSCGKCFPLITEDGLVFVLPCNKRMPFLEYVTSCNVTWLRCYTVKKLRNFNYNYECSFDIVTPISLRKNNIFLPDAEILLILYEIITSFRNLVPHNFSININHSMLFEAILEECQIIKSPFYDYILLITHAYSYFGMSKETAYDLLTLYLGPGLLNKYTSFLEDSENYFSGSNAYLEKFQITNAKRKAHTALIELTNIVIVAKQLGFKHKVNLKPILMKSFQRASGMIVELRHSYKNNVLQIAEGVRYDRYLESLQVSRKSYQNYGVGLTVSAENLNFILKGGKSLKLSEVIVCSYSNKVIPYVHKVLKILWNNNICCSYVKFKSEKHLNKYCSKHNISCSVTLTNKGFQYKTCLISHRNYSLIHHRIELNYLIPMVNIILNQEQTDQIVISNKEQAVFYKTTFKLSLYDKVKCKIKLTEYLNTLPIVMGSKVLFVTNLDCIEEFMSLCHGQSTKQMM